MRERKERNRERWLRKSAKKREARYVLFFRAADSGAGYKSKKLPIFHERYVNGKRYLNGKVLISLVNSPRSRHGEANTFYGTDRKIRKILSQHFSWHNFDTLGLLRCTSEIARGHLCSI